ncbi:MAG TPA: carbamoyltransferase HypF, partial [Pyrinomonadaceae bacterium]|nr:carbamoyltransferase HypF [Pyrinomonadaceae bacterium]
MNKRVQIQLQGVVQGVGFRPFVYLLAQRCALRGQVQNNGAGVQIDLEGEPGAIEQFIARIRTTPPPLSRIESIERQNDLAPLNYDSFRIVPSTAAAEKRASVSPDIATCADCLRELFDSADRRYRFPFINCTNCGPRYTIIENIPYDRVRTTMHPFQMCDECKAEYENPLDRRFHAEPIACARCGPTLYLTDADGCEVNTAGVDAIECTKRLLLQGRIVAVKGIGGFHLACNALDHEAVRRLRAGKFREDKPFAMMAGSIDVIRQFCEVSKAEEDLLLSSQRPIVLLDRLERAGLPEAVAPRTNVLGFMLPYSPVHHLLLAGSDHPLVMTSGNISDEPICYRDAEALKRLNRIADYFLLHNRRIHRRTDDSIVRAEREARSSILRRSRGYAPLPLRLPISCPRTILACGAELKNTFCFLRGSQAYLSQHIGDLQNLETLESFSEGIDDFQRLFNLNPEVIAYDLHPEYLSTKFALAFDSVRNRIAVQHHHAHLASCLVDNDIDGPVIGVAMDGLGYGTDGHLWGGEFFIASVAQAQRVAHLDYVPMPGGTKAIREPWRMAAVYLQRAFGEEFSELHPAFTSRLNRNAWSNLQKLIDRRINCPETSSMGRLFDAVSSLLGLADIVNYEGQAAMALEAVADPRCLTGYEFGIDFERGLIDAGPVIRSIVIDVRRGTTAPTISARFHQAVVDLIVSMALQLRGEHLLNSVALSGGVFQNSLLRELCRQQLAAHVF